MLERFWVVLVVLGYLSVGGLLFQLIEPPPSYPPSKHLAAKYTDACLNQLWIITERLNVLYQRNWTKLVTEELKRLEMNVVQATRRETITEVNQQWSFTGSLLYSLTVITTIGCGSGGPRTVEGKVATMVYALIGVPLMLACLTHLGSQLAELIENAYYYVCCCKRKGRSKETNGNERSDFQLEERGCGKLREVEVVGGSCGRAVCRLTSLDSLRDYPRTTVDSDDEELELTRGGRINDTPSRVPLIWRGAGSYGDIPRRSATPPPSRGYQQTPPPPPPPSTKSKRPPVPPLVSILLVTSYLCLGAWIFASWGRRSYVEGLYFTFTALTTIGLGELTPPGTTVTPSATGVAQSSGQAPGSRTTHRRHHHDSQQLHLLVVSLYILVGLLLVATSLALVHETLMAKTRQLATSLGMTKREELAV